MVPQEVQKINAPRLWLNMYQDFHHDVWWKWSQNNPVGHVCSVSLCSWNNCDPFHFDGIFQWLINWWCVWQILLIDFDWKMAVSKLDWCGQLKHLEFTPQLQWQHFIPKNSPFVVWVANKTFAAMPKCCLLWKETEVIASWHWVGGLKDWQNENDKHHAETHRKNGQWSEIVNQPKPHNGEHKRDTQTLALTVWKHFSSCSKSLWGNLKNVENSNGLQMMHSVKTSQEQNWPEDWQLLLLLILFGKVKLHGCKCFLVFSLSSNKNVDKNVFFIGILLLTFVVRDFLNHFAFCSSFPMAVPSMKSSAQIGSEQQLTHACAFKFLNKLNLCALPWQKGAKSVNFVRETRFQLIAFAKSSFVSAVSILWQGACNKFFNWALLNAFYIGRICGKWKWMAKQNNRKNLCNSLQFESNSLSCMCISAILSNSNLSWKYQTKTKSVIQNGFLHWNCFWFHKPNFGSFVIQVSACDWARFGMKTAKKFLLMFDSILHGSFNLPFWVQFASWVSVWIMSGKQNPRLPTKTKNAFLQIETLQNWNQENVQTLLPILFVWMQVTMLSPFAMEMESVKSCDVKKWKIKWFFSQL